jgi:hypothetical protein
LDSKTKTDQPLFKKAFNPLRAYQDSGLVSVDLIYTAEVSSPLSFNEKWGRIEQNCGTLELRSNASNAQLLANWQTKSYSLLLHKKWSSISLQFAKSRTWESDLNNGMVPIELICITIYPKTG